MDSIVLQPARRKSKTQKYKIHVCLDLSESHESEIYKAEKDNGEATLSQIHTKKRSLKDNFTLSRALARIQNLQSLVDKLETKASSQAHALCSHSKDELLLESLENKMQIIQQRRENAKINEISDCHQKCLLI